MIYKKISLLIALFSLAYYGYHKIELPNNVVEYDLLKIHYIAFRAAISLGGYAANLNYGNEPVNIRNFMTTPAKYFLGQINPDIKVLDTQIAGVSVRIYKPYSSLNEKNLPILIYYHGGAYFLGHSAFYDEYLSELSKTVNMVAIFVDYRMAPEHPFPTPTNDCYSVTKYVLESADEFGDTDRVILAGDSAGGNAVAVMTQKLLAANVKMPKLQALFSPWLQMFNNRMPATIKYPIIHSTIGKWISWYLGYNVVSNDLNELIKNNSHTLLLTDPKLKEKLKSYMDVDLIPMKYKAGKDYYNVYNNIKDEVFPTSIDSSSILNKDKELRDSLSKIFTAEFSPGLADDEELVGLPNAYFVACEVDPIKDQGLIYSERLRRAGVNVHVQFYEDCFHAANSFINKHKGFSCSKKMFNDFVRFISKNI